MRQENSILPSFRCFESFYIESLGCSKNLVDSEVIIEALKSTGLSFTTEPEEADIIVINTCGFIQSAKEEAIETIFGFCNFYPGKCIIATGCLAQRYQDLLFEKIPELTAIFGNRQPDKIAELVEKLKRESRIALYPERDSIDFKRDTLLSDSRTTYLKIAEGCNNGCSFCAIPLIKGELASRSVESVVREVKSLVKKGIFEINLIAQDLGSYGVDRGEWLLPPLLDQISHIKGNFSIRLLYLHPDRLIEENYGESLLKVMQRDKRFLPYFDIPFQHADSKILKRMGRTFSSTEYIKLIELIREAFPDSVIRSTFLIGFPGEGPKSIENLRQFQKRAKIEWVGLFFYSPEESTRAYRQYKVYQKIKNWIFKDRWRNSIERLQTTITEERLNRFIGKQVDILVEEPIEGSELAIGRCYMQAPEVDGAMVIHSLNLKEGDIVKCRITARRGFDLEAVPL